MLMSACIAEEVILLFACSVVCSCEKSGKRANEFLGLVIKTGHMVYTVDQAKCILTISCSLMTFTYR